MMNIENLRLGKKYRDMKTGFEGIAIDKCDVGRDMAYVNWIDVCLEPQQDEDISGVLKPRWVRHWDLEEILE